MTLSLGLGIVRWTVGVYATVMKTHAPNQQLLLYRRLVPKLLQPQLILSFPLGPGIEYFVYIDRRIDTVIVTVSCSVICNSRSLDSGRFRM